MSLCDIPQLLEAIHSKTQKLKFQQIMHQAMDTHVFRINIEPIKPIVNSILELLNEFIVACLRIVLLKLLYDNLVKNKCGLMEGQAELKRAMQKIQKCTEKVHASIKSNYFLLMQRMPHKKCETIEFLLFLICFSTKTIIIGLCNSSDALQQQFQYDTLQYHNDQFAAIACTLINYEITGLTVKRNVYKTLKNKYYKEKSKAVLKRRNNIRSAYDITQSPMKRIAAFKYAKGKTKENKENDQFLSKYVNKPDKLSKQQTQFTNEIKNILNFQKSSLIESNKHAEQGNKMKQLRKTTQKQCKQTDKPAFAAFSSKPTKILKYMTIRPSQAFIQNQYPCQSLDRQYSTTNNSLHKNIFNHKKRYPYIRQRNVLINEISHGQLTNIFTQRSFNQLFLKNEKKNQNCEIQPKITNWGQKVRNLLKQQHIQKIQIPSPNRWRKNHHSAQQIQYANKQLQKSFQFVKKLRKANSKKIQQQSINFRTGFCQHIDQRDPVQIGIVRNICNFQPSTSENNEKMNSKVMKKQYENFIKKSQEASQNFKQDRNFMYRMQKVITGSNKL